MGARLPLEGLRVLDSGELHRPAHAEHTDAVLAALGYSSAEITRLREAGALG